MVGEAVECAQVLGRQLEGGAELNLHLHVSQVDPGGQGARAVVTLLGFLDEVVCRRQRKQGATCYYGLPFYHYSLREPQYITHL